MIHGSLRQHIAKITGQRSRALRVTLDRAKSKMPIHIISTYSPRNGRKEEARRKHWEDAKERLNKTCRRRRILWGSDANGQMGSRNQEEKYATKENADRRIIGPYTKASKTEK